MAAAFYVGPEEDRNRLETTKQTAAESETINDAYSELERTIESFERKVQENKCGSNSKVKSK